MMSVSTDGNRLMMVLASWVSGVTMKPSAAKTTSPTGRSRLRRSMSTTLKRARVKREGWKSVASIDRDRSRTTARALSVR